LKVMLDYLLMMFTPWDWMLFLPILLKVALAPQGNAAIEVRIPNDKCVFGVRIIGVQTDFRIERGK